MSSRGMVVALIVLGWTAGAGSLVSVAVAEESATQPPVDFLRDIRPLLQQRCVHCHGPERADGSLRLDRREHADRGGHTGSPILGGTSATNSILQRVTSTDVALRMPKNAPPLSGDEITLLRRWVEQGTPWTDPPRDPPVRPARYELSWEALQPWNPADWPNARFERLKWWLLRFGPVWVAVLLWIGFSDRCRLWVRTGHPRVQPPRGARLRRLAAVPRSAHVATLLGLGLVTWVAFSQQQGRRADAELDALRAEAAALQSQLNAPLVERDGAPRPVKPRHPPRLGGEYYRGNDERNPALFNGGFYRTCIMRVWLCRADDSILAWGDAVDPRACRVRFEIEQSPGATDGLFAPEVFAASYISAAAPQESIRAAAAQIATFTGDGPRRWVARLPLDLTPATQGVQTGTLYLARGEPPGTGGRASDPHYAAEYSLRIVDGRIAPESELWLGYVFRTGNVLPVPPGKIPEDEWFSFRPIPEIVGGQTTTDPQLLGIEEHRGPPESERTEPH